MTESEQVHTPRPPSPFRISVLRSRISPLSASVPSAPSEEAVTHPFRHDLNRYEIATLLSPSCGPPRQAQHCHSPPCCNCQVHSRGQLWPRFQPSAGTVLYPSSRLDVDTPLHHPGADEGEEATLR